MIKPFSLWEHSYGIKLQGTASLNTLQDTDWGTVGPSYISWHAVRAPLQYNIYVLNLVHTWQHGTVQEFDFTFEDTCTSESQLNCSRDIWPTWPSLFFISHVMWFALQLTIQLPS